MRTCLTKSAAILLALCMAWPQGLVFAAQPDNGKQPSELDTLLQASKPKTVVFDGIEVSDDQVIMKLSGKAKHQTQLLADPPRLLIDIFGADYQVGVKSIPGKGPHIKSVRGGQYKPAPDMVSRIVVDLNDQVPYRVAMEGNSLVLVLMAPEAAAYQEPAKAPAAEKAAPVKAAAAPVKAAAAPVKAAAAPVKATAAPVKAAAAPVKAAAAPVEASAAAAPPTAPSPAPAKPRISVPKAQPKTAVVAQMPALASTPAANPVSLPPPAAAAAPASVPPSRTGGKCSSASGTDILSRLPCDLVDLDFDNTNIKDIFSLLSAKAQVNIISGADVSGNLTLHLKGVPFDEAFRTIMNMMGLTTLQVGENILRVMTQATLSSVQSSATNLTKVVALRYAKAVDIQPTLKSVQGAEGRTKGSILIDDKSNSLILSDSLEGISSLERLIAQLDGVPKQVLIEAKLVEVKLNSDLDFGIKWDFFKTQTGKFLGEQGLTAIGSAIVQTPTTLTSQTIPPTPYRESASIATLPSAGSGTGVSLLPGGPVGLLTLGRVTNNYFLNAQLGALAQERKLKVLSDPKVATLNNKPAEINVTDQVPYDISVVSAQGTISRNVAFVDIGITLKVTPSISADDSHITLDINPTVSKPSGAAGASVSGAPPKSMSTVKTIVIVKDGETVVIGGLITDSKETRINKVPLLGDIPILGWLFKKKFDTRERKELLIFVTPRIIKDA